MSTMNQNPHLGECLHIDLGYEHGVACIRLTSIPNVPILELNLTTPEEV